MKIWITGCAGFLGSGLAVALASDGHEITGIDRRPSSQAHHSIIIDLGASDAAALLARLAAEDGRPEAVVHLASVQPASQHTLADYVRGNVLSAANVVDALRELPPERMLYTSTLSVYGQPEVNPVSESCCQRPEHPYAVTKLAAERLIMTLTDRAQAIVLRLPSMFGIGQGDSFIDGLVGRARDNTPLRLYSQGLLLRDVLHVDEVIEAIAGCITVPLPERSCVMNLGSGLPLRTVDYATLIVQAMHSGSEIQLEDHPAAQPYDLYADIEKARRLIGFDPADFRLSLEQYCHALRALP